jgi:hypothetical protein
MEFLSEDPTFVVGALGILGLALLVAVRATQQGKYLIGAGLAFGLAGLVVAVERAWVTDNERIERVVYELASAAAASDAHGVLDRLAPDVQFVIQGSTQPGDETRAVVESALANVRFDLVRVKQLRANAGEESRRGTAEFKVLCSGEYDPPGYSRVKFGATDSTWSLGFRETSPGVWKVNRITPVYAPGLAIALRPRISASGPSLTPPPNSARLDLERDPSRGGGGDGFHRHRYGIRRRQDWEGPNLDLPRPAPLP